MGYIKTTTTEYKGYLIEIGQHPDGAYDYTIYKKILFGRDVVEVAKSMTYYFTLTGVKIDAEIEINNIIKKYLDG